MHATDAAQLATTVVTNEQKHMSETAMAQIEQAARRGQRSVTLFPKRPAWLKTYLEGEGYTVKLTQSGNQLDGPMLEVRW